MFQKSNHEFTQSSIYALSLVSLVLSTVIPFHLKVSEFYTLQLRQNTVAKSTLKYFTILFYLSFEILNIKVCYIKRIPENFMMHSCYFISLYSKNNR